MLATWTVAIACSQDDNGSVSFAAGCILDTLAAARCDDCLLFEHQARLGEIDGPGSLTPRGGIESVIRDRRGNYWVGQGHWMSVYRPDGEFLTTVGREGEGPMEFQYGRPIHVDGFGRVHVFDAVMTRVSEIDETLALSDEKRLPGASAIGAIAPLDDGQRYAIQAWIPTPDLLGLPIHVVEGQTIITSFGLPESERVEEPGFISQIAARRHLATNDGNQIFAARYYDYVVEAWSEHGDPLGRLEGLPPLDDGLRGPRNAPSLENPPWNELVAIHAGTDSLLWVLSRFRRPDWRDQSEEMVYPDGGVTIAPTDLDPTNWYYSRIDVVDPGTCTLVASRSREEFFVGFVGHGLMAAGESTEAGVPYVNIYRTKLGTAPSGTSGNSAR